MTNFAIPIRPAGSDQRHIADIETDFDFVTGLLDSAVARRKLIWRSKCFVGSGVTTGVYIIELSGTLVASGTGNTQSFEWIYYNSGDYPAYSGKTLNFYLRVAAATGIAPGVTLGLELRPLTSSGTGGQVAPTAGGTVEGSAVVPSSVVGSTTSRVDGAAFALTSGAHVPVINVGGTTAVGSGVALMCELLYGYS